MNIETEYNLRKNRPSDINEHLETLYKYGAKCKTIAELGTRNGNSTIALLNSNPDKMTSYDLFKADFIDNLSQPNFHFIQQDSLKIELEQVDLLFIDTLHRYFQLFSELSLHAKKVNKYIIMHDTVSYGYTDEALYRSGPCIASDKILVTEKKGLLQAITDFLKTTKEGKNWKIHEVFENNNGLTILSRI